MTITVSRGNCQYTALTTVGTTTINPGQASGPPTQPGAFYGANMVSVGTSFGVTVYDIYVAGTATTTVILATGTSTAVGGLVSPGPGPLGVRYRGALVAVTTGTAGQYNALWD